MSVTELLDRATAAGILFILEGDRIRLRAPAPPPAELLASLRAHKAELLAHLRRQARSEVSRVGPWQPAGAIAPPRQCVSCRGGLQPSDPDNGPCGSCRWFEATMPTRVQ